MTKVIEKAVLYQVTVTKSEGEKPGLGIMMGFREDAGKGKLTHITARVACSDYATLQREVMLAALTQLVSSSLLADVTAAEDGDGLVVSCRSEGIKAELKGPCWQVI